MRFIRLADGRTWSISGNEWVDSGPEGAATMFVDSFEDLQARLRGHALPLPGPYISADVDRERDRRLRTVPFMGHIYDFCDDRGSDINIAGAGSMAIAALMAGAVQGDLRWHGGDSDFAWVAADNAIVTMDAQTVLSFAMTAGRWKSAHIRAARALKDLSAVPDDYASNLRWPA